MATLIHAGLDINRPVRAPYVFALVYCQHTDRQTDRQTNGQTVRLKCRRTDRDTDERTERQKPKEREAEAKQTKAPAVT